MSRILIVEDDEDLRSGLASILSAAGYGVLVADEGQAGLDLINRCAPDLVISDIVMDGKEGIATILELKRSHAHIPVMSISGNQHYLQSSAKLGADASLLKPFTAREFLSAVEKLLPAA